MKSNPDEQDNTLRPLVALSRSRKVNNLSQFAEAASLLTIGTSVILFNYFIPAS